MASRGPRIWHRLSLFARRFGDPGDGTYPYLVARRVGDQVNDTALCLVLRRTSNTVDGAA